MEQVGDISNTKDSGFSKEEFLKVRVKEFGIPPIKDGLIVGRKAPIGPEAMERCLKLLCNEHFQRLKPDDDVIEEIFLRSSILKKISAAKMIQMILENMKPIMCDSEILVLDIKLEVFLEGAL